MARRIIAYKDPYKKIIVRDTSHFVDETGTSVIFKYYACGQKQFPDHKCDLIDTAKIPAGEVKFVLADIMWSKPNFTAEVVSCKDVQILERMRVLVAPELIVKAFRNHEAHGNTFTVMAKISSYQNEVKLKE